MKLLLKIESDRVEISLQSGKKTVDQLVFKDACNLSEKTLPSIDKLLKRNRITLAQVEKVETKTNIPESYTSSRIAETIAKALNIKVKEK